MLTIAPYLYYLSALWHRHPLVQQLLCTCQQPLMHYWKYLTKQSHLSTGLGGVATGVNHLLQKSGYFDLPTTA